MDFKEDLQNLAAKIESQRTAIKTEEGTKNAFIMPMLHSLGYDVFNPMDVEPEMDCDLTNHGDKVDYAIRINGEVAMLVECKHWRQNLSLHSTQLKKYFVASNAKFGILTNGIRYQFYTDTERENLMDDIPFLDINILDISQQEMDFLLKFHKSNFNKNEIINSISKSKSYSSFKQAVLDELRSPSDDLTRHFVKSVFGTVAQGVVKEYKPLLRQAIQDYFSTKAHAVTTDAIREEEHIEKPYLDAYKLIKNIIEGLIRDDEEVLYFQTQSYFSVGLCTKWWWICRMRQKNNSLQVYFNHGRGNSGNWIDIASAKEMNNYSEEIKASYGVVSQSLHDFRNRH